MSAVAGAPPAPPTGMARTRAWLGLSLLYALSIATALVVAGLLIQATGRSATAAVNAFYTGSLAGGGSIGQTIDEAAPLLLVALGTVISARAGIFNIGQEGQLLVGAMVATAVALHAPGPGWLGLTLTLLGAAAGGGAWAGIAALLRHWRGVDVVISTLLLSFIAVQVVGFATTRAWLLQEHGAAGAVVSPESDAIGPAVRLARVGAYPNLNFSTGAIIALLLAVLLVVALRRSSWGFRLRLLGLNAAVARRSGVSERHTGALALILSGGFAGLAGGVMLTASAFRLQAGLADNVGNEGLLVALVGHGSALLAVPVAFFFGALRSGGGFLASTGVPRYLVEVVQALLVLATVVPALARGRRGPVRPAAAAAPGAVGVPPA